MTKIAYTLALLSAALFSSYSAPAHARARVFVASYGNDSNPCTFGSPCKTFQVAVNAVDAGGEVTAIDSAGFGPINITKAVTITSPDGVEAGIVPASGGDAIDITAGVTDAIVLRGLTLNGSGVGANGIVFNSGASLTVTNCVAQNLTADGVAIQPASGITTAIISNTHSLNNGANGILIRPTGSASVFFSIDKTTASKNNSNGIDVDASASANHANGMITDSHADYNGANGIAGIGQTGFFNVWIHVKNSFATTLASWLKTPALLWVLFRGLESFWTTITSQ
jgi:hypothetical protein